MTKRVKQIAFFLPGKESHPVGGYKIVYEYANRFCNAGYDVLMVYPHIRADYGKKNHNSFLNLKRCLGFHFRRFLHQYTAGRWFNLDPRIKQVFIFKFSDFYIRKLKSAQFIATAVQTAYELNTVRCIPSKNKYYFIQDFEAWHDFTDEMVLESYRFPMKKIVIAPWLKEKVESVGSSAVLIPNGFDFDYFTLSVPIEMRKTAEIAMLYHCDDRKRCCDAMAALGIVKKEIPELHVSMFGTPNAPDNLADWYTYYQCPDKATHNRIYNEAAVFVAASKAEGMALPPGEAMICGAALCCTDIGGFELYAIDNETALLSPVYDIHALAENITTLIKNQKMRIQIAEAGHEYIKRFSWDTAFSLFKGVLEE